MIGVPGSIALLSHDVSFESSYFANESVAVKILLAFLIYPQKVTHFDGLLSLARVYNRGGQSAALQLILRPLVLLSFERNISKNQINTKIFKKMFDFSLNKHQK